MEKNGKTPNKALYIVLSIVVACALWLYVRNVDNPDRKVTISNIPVTFVGEDVLNSNGLMLPQDTRAAVDLEVQGKWSVLSRLRRDNITLTVDLSRIVAEGRHNLAYDITWPGAVSGNAISVLDRDPFYVSVDIVRSSTKSVEVRGVFTGSVAKRYQAGEFSFQPAAVEISGEEAAVGKVAYAQVTVNRKDLSESVREDMSYVLIGQDGEVIEDRSLTVTPATVNVSLPVVMVKEVPLTVDFTPGGGVTGDDVKHLDYDIEPASIVLSGGENDLAAYTSINLGAIDLSKVVGTAEFTFPIPLGTGVENVSGVEEATVTVTVHGLETVTMETSNIEIINVPEGHTAVPVTQTIKVQVRGSEEALERVLPQYIRVVVDLKDLSLPEGQNVQTAKVSLNGVADAGVIGEYKIAFTLTEGGGS